MNIHMKPEKGRQILKHGVKQCFQNSKNMLYWERGYSFSSIENKKVWIYSRLVEI